VIVFDGATGKYLRHWGAYGNVPDDTERFDPKTMVSGALPKQFSTPHGITGSTDGKIYVADRRSNRIQVFDHQGKFIAEKVIAPATLSSGSAFVPVLSPDAQQQWLYVADGTNHKIWILRRADLEIVGEFGRGGRQLGQMLRPHGMSIDTQGNL
jgi:DNA-binding beta-propeller fold protein YncE